MEKTKVIFIDFDGCLMNTPEVDAGIDQWVETKKLPYPYPQRGWWSKPESLDMEVFDIQPFEAIYNIVKNAEAHVTLVMLTNRMKKLEDLVRKILDKHDVKFDHYSFKQYHNETKGERIEKFLTYHPEYNEVEFYDDMQKYIDSALFLPEKMPDIDFKFFLVKDGAITNL